MLYKVKNIISDGKKAKIVDSGVTWHSDMDISDIPGEETDQFPQYPQVQKLDANISKPPSFNWMPKKRFCHKPYVIPKKYLR